MFRIQGKKNNLHHRRFEYYRDHKQIQGLEATIYLQGQTKQIFEPKYYVLAIGKTSG